MSLLNNEVAAAMGRIPSGIFILTVQLGSRRSAMLASFVMQSSFDPPMITVAVNGQRFLADWLRETEGNKSNAVVAINIVGAESKHLLSTFGKGFPPDVDAFAGTPLIEEVAEVPVLADALAYLAGSVAGWMVTGDHVVFAIEIKQGKLLAESAPMVHIRKDGSRY